MCRCDVSGDRYSQEGTVVFKQVKSWVEVLFLRWIVGTDL